MATEKRLIDANDLSNAIPGISKDMKRPGAVELACLLMIAEAPTVDAVEVIRCKNCKYGKLDTSDDYGWYLCEYDGSSWNKGEHFCSYGERKK